MINTAELYMSINHGLAGYHIDVIMRGHWVVNICYDFQLIADEFLIRFFDI